MFQICVKGVWFIGGQLLISVPFFFLRENKSWNQWLKATRAKDVSSEHVLFLGNFLFFFFFWSEPQSMQDPSSPTRDWTHASYSESAVLTTGSPGKSL